MPSSISLLADSANLRDLDQRPLCATGIAGGTFQSELFLCRSLLGLRQLNDSLTIIISFHAFVICQLQSARTCHDFAVIAETAMPRLLIACFENGFLSATILVFQCVLVDLALTQCRESLSGSIYISIHLYSFPFLLIHSLFM